MKDGTLMINDMDQKMFQIKKRLINNKISGDSNFMYKLRIIQYVHWHCSIDHFRDHKVLDTRLYAKNGYIILKANGFCKSLWGNVLLGGKLKVDFKKKSKFLRAMPFNYM